MPQETWTGGSSDNGRTIVMSGRPRRALAPRAAFLVAHERLSLLAAVAAEPTVVVAAVDADARVVSSQTLATGNALVVGRHTQCDLRLDGGAISLRHLLVLAHSEAGTSVLRAWDLRTGVPFISEDGRADVALMSDGPLYLAIDQYALWLLPVRGPLPRDPEAAWEALPPRSFIERRSASSSAPPPPSQPSLRKARRGGANISRVTSLAPPLLLGEGDEPEIGWGELRLAADGERERRLVSAERLGQGVLIGRYERCGLVVRASDRLSRVHLMLVRIGVGVWAVDTASTNGVRRDGVPLRAALLRDVDCLSLGGVLTIDWRRTLHPDA